MEAGNNLEQSVALVAAANKVVQDPNSVGSALRTISLRLRGTSVEILQEMGEETDGVVESVSKMQEKIKGLTGVDILTDSGAYKDTYTILYEIGKVWNSLEHLDRSALLELMAGKNRANTLAAILNNMEDLEGAYEAALDADGSALQENLTYLDSIDGKIKLVTNSIQTMWMNLLDSTVLKFLLDVANGLIKIADKIGVINTAVAAFAGFRAFSSKNTFGNTFKLDKESGFGLNEESFGGQAIKGIGSLINKIFNKDSVDDYAGAINDAGDAAKNATDNVIYLSSAQRGQQAAATDAQKANLGVVDSTQILDKSSKKAAFGAQLLNSALSMGIAFLASVAIQALIKGLYNLAHAEEQAADRATDAVNAYRSANKELKDQKITIDELASDYERLSSGVNTATNTNIGLTTEAYEEYLDVCNDIADMYPELIVGYDAQGNAIIDLKGNVEALTRAYEDAKRAAASQFLTPGNKEDIWTDYNNSVNEDVKKKWWGSWMPSGTIQEQQEMLDHFTKMTNEDFAALLDASEDINNAWGSADRELGKNGRSFYNILYDSGYDGAYLDNGKLTSFLNDTGLDFEGIAKQIEDGDITLTEGINTLRLNVSTALSNASATISTSMSKMQETVSASLIFDPVYQGLDDKAKGIVQSLVDNIDPEMIAESGAQSADEFIKYFSEHIITGIRDNQSLFNDLTSVSDKIAKAMSDGNQTDFDAATAEFNALVEGWRGADGEITIDEDADAVTQYLQNLAQNIEDKSKNYQVKIQFQHDFDYKSSFNEILNNSENAIDKEAVQKALSGIGLDTASTIDVIYDTISKTLSGDDGKLFGDELIDQYEEYIDTLASAGSESDALQQLTDAGWTAEQVSAIQSLSFVMDAYGTDIDTVKAKLIELGLALPSIQDTGLFDLASEKTQELVETFEGNMSSIKEAWNSLNDGSMTKSEFIELAMELPEAMDGVNLADDNWMVKAKENLEKLNKTKADEFISTLNEIKAAMDAQGHDTSVVDSFINYATKLQNTLLSEDEKDKTVPNTISDLIAAYENYNAILEETNEIIYDGQKVSEDYYQSLRDCIDDVEALDSCFDGTNKQIVTNAKKLKDLIKQQKQETANLSKIARAQSQLQYQDLVQDLIRATFEYERNTDAGYEEIESLLEQIDVVKDTIDQYKRLELSLFGATNAYEKFQKAQQIDQDTDYESQTINILEAIGSGFDTGKVGLEAFNAGIKAIFSESVYGDLSDVEDLDAVWEAFTGTNLKLTNGANIANLFNWSKDDGFTITIDNMKSFIEQAEKLGVFAEGSTFEDFSLKAGTYLKDVAEAFGLSEEAAYAYLEILSDYSIGGGSLVDELADVQYDTAIESATDNLAELAEKKAEMLKSGQYDPADMQQLNLDIIEAKNNLDVANKAAIDHAKQYAALAALNNGLSNGVNLTKDQIDSLVDQYNTLTGKTYTLNVDGKSLVDAKGNVVAVSDLLAKLGAQPTVLEIQLAVNNIQSQIDSLNKEKETIAKDGITQEIQVKYGAGSLTKVTKQIDEEIKGLEEQLGTFELQYGVTPSDSEQEAGTYETLSMWSKDGINTELNVDITDFADKKAEIEKPMSTTLTVNTVTGTTMASGAPTSSTINFNIGEGYQSALNAISDLSAKCAIPIEQLVEVSDDGTISVVEGALDTLNEYELKNKYLTTSINGYSTILSQLNTIISKLQTIDNIDAVATIAVEGSGSLALGTDPGPATITRPSKYVENQKRHLNNTVFATGSPGLPHAEKGALVGELGPEAVVDPASGTWQTVGNFGAEFVDLPKGAIIFNHLQTQELLSHGHTTRGKMVNGSAFAGGRAFAHESLYYKHKDWPDNGNPFNNDVNSGNNSVDDAIDEFAETIDGIEIRMEELDEALGLLSAELENAVNFADKNDIIGKMVEINKQKYADSLAGSDKYYDKANEYWSQIPAAYRELAKNGAIEIKDFTNTADEAVVEAINKYREYAQKAADLTQQAEEAITEIRDLAIQRISEAYESGKVRADVEDSQTEKLQNRVDLDEEKGLVTSDAYYIAMMENSNKKIEYLTSARDNMQKALDTAVRNGELIKGSNEWYEQINELYGIDAEIAEATIELEEFQNAINDIYWDNFENLTNQIEYLKDQTQSLIDLMENSGDLVAEPEKRKYEGGTVEYWTADDVEWTDEGLASLGLYAQQMEIAEFEARQYAEAIDDLNEQYADGRYSESEYLEKLEELTSAQYDAIDSYYEAQDAIVELNEARIDSIKNGIEKEIDAYEELIGKKKEELSAEKDLYDFQKSTMQQQKNIADIERKLAALANDNSLSAAAKRKQLEAELAEAQYDLQDTYYNRSVEDKQTALDRELEDFQNEKNAELQILDKYLDDVELVVRESLETIQQNASGIYDTLSSKAQEYDLTLSDSIMSPWKDGALAVNGYQEVFDTSMSSTMQQLDALKAKWQSVIEEMARAGRETVNTINKQNESYISATQQHNIRDTYSGGSKNQYYDSNSGGANKNNGSNANANTGSGNITVGGKINAGSARIYQTSSGTGGSSQYFSNDPIYTVLQESNGYLLVRHHSASSGYSGWFKKTDVRALATGTTSLNKSGIVNIDELGEELVIRAQNGRLTYMEKGSGVVPADLTSNLMEWGKLDPTSMIEQNRPSITAPVVQNKEVNIDLTYGDILHIEEFHGDDPDEIAKIVAKQFEKHTKQLNNSIRKFAR